MKALRELKQSELLRHARALEQAKYPSYRTRALHDEEILVLERGQNICSDWSLIRVDLDFDPSKIRRCFLSGELCLPRFFGTLQGPEGVPYPAGVYDSTLHDCSLENAHIASVGTLARMIISQGCVIRQVGSLAVSGRTSFGVGREIRVGSEMGGREFLLWPEVPFDAMAALTEDARDVDLRSLWEQSLIEYRDQVAVTRGYVGKDAILSQVPLIRNCYIGAGARVFGAQKLHDCVLLSKIEQPCVVRDGAIVERSFLQWGSLVASGAIVSHSILCEESSAQRLAKLNHAVIGPNSHVQAGEITSSLLGPFVGFHHQSLLISTLWPEGMGNVAHAAAVGSNHTGRQPDQECRVGRGVFFGMGVVIKFPCNLKDARWSLLAPGVTSPPQRMDFPFSLMSPGRNPKAFKNELVPGWVLRYGAFALIRNEAKFQSRNRSRRQTWSAEVFGAETAQLVLRAVQRLDGVAPIREVYVEEQIVGLGKNYLTEANRQKALSWYKAYLERFLLHGLMTQLEKDPSLLRREIPVRRLLQNDLIREVSKWVSLPDSVALIPKHFRNVEKYWFEQAQADFERDAERGRVIFDDYDSTHDVLSSTAFLQVEVEKAMTRCRDLIRLGKEFGRLSSESSWTI